MFFSRKNANYLHFPNDIANYFREYYKYKTGIHFQKIVEMSYDHIKEVLKKTVYCSFLTEYGSHLIPGMI